MREIKFRGWNRELKVMVYSNELTGGIDYECNPVRALNIILNEDDHGFDYMQYTGLKDKNGTEIYEGDVVTLYCQENRGEWKDFDVTGKVTYFTELAQFLVKRENSHPQLGFDLFEMCDHPDYELLEKEVIGNIHENPHLLEVTK